ncbi:MAG: ribosome maturation factor RimP [Oscillospiraceae bacterium]
MIKGKKPNTCDLCADIAKPVLEELGLTLWDVRFEKEGSAWFLRYYIDKETGATIDDCENFSRGVDPLLDEADPIELSYYLEVSSPGTERELTRDWHFEKCKDELINIRLIRAVEGERDFDGVLKGYSDGKITILLENDVVMEIAKSDTAFIRLCDTFDINGGEI